MPLQPSLTWGLRPLHRLEANAPCLTFPPGWQALGSLLISHTTSSECQWRAHIFPSAQTDHHPKSSAETTGTHPTSLWGYLHNSCSTPGCRRAELLAALFSPVSLSLFLMAFHHIPRTLWPQSIWLLQKAQSQNQAQFSKPLTWTKLSPALAAD